MSAQIALIPANTVVYTDNESGKFTDCSNNTRNYILRTYLPVKLGKYMGISEKAVTPGSGVRFAEKYNNDEGVIKPYDIVKGLRIDLQKAQEIDGKTYACLQVQWGTGQDGKKGGAYAGALILTEQAFSIVQIETALEKSFGSKSYWRLDPG
ncbi:hypothetical protein [Massilia sp. S19_KUP03_FR1]|uniref:hypothetical protein n=1 Tax=Massilia sp. S19_KUP03_FR1 TaxID=3025503 RepID=UPI002FCDC94B